MTREELIEKVARAICQNPPICACDDMRISCCSKSAHEAARAASDIVLEEAANVAEGVAPRTSVKDGDETEAYFLALDDAAANIRALKSGDGE